MCFDGVARPPQPPRTGASAGGRRLTLAGGDGTEVAARLAATSAADAPGIVILPDVRGLHPYYELLAEAFAQAGLHALAIDLYSRTAGTAYRDDDFDFAPHRERVTDEQVASDVRAAAAHLRGLGCGRVFVVGFCFGGRQALLQASRPGIDGVIGFYGSPTRQGPEGRSPLAEAREGPVRCPVLALYGGADQGIPAADIEAYDAALEAAGVPHRMVVYPGAPHSFFDRTMDEHAEACADAWRRILEFTDPAN
ncbi:MAG: dienelactone hydrolase family protein [Acidimicrobiia bacterium]